METLVYLPIDSIISNPYQPRRYFDQSTLEELAKSIQKEGLIQPIIVRQSAVVGYELLAGERRLKASKIAGLDKIPAIIKPLTDEEMMVHSIIENLQRDDLNPIEEALSYKRLYDKNMTHDEIAQKMGKSRPYISNMLRLLSLSSHVQEALKSGTISPGHAKLLISLSKDQQETILALIVNKQLSVRQLENELGFTRKTKTASKKINPTILEQEDLLHRLTGLPVTIKTTNNSSGYIQFNYQSLDDFDRLIHILSDK